MKKFIFILFLIIFQISFAQKATKNELITALSNSCCDCISGKEIKPDKVELTLGVCILKAIKDNKEDVVNHYGKDYFSNMEKIGEEIGAELAINCPDFLALLSTEGVLDKYTTDEELIDESYGNDLSLVSSYVSSKEDGFLYVTVKEYSGKSHQMILINNFENAYLVTDNVLKKNDKIEIYYFEAELYDAKYKKFINCKIISDIIKL